LEELEGKISEELATLKENLVMMQTNSAKFSSIDELRHSTEQKRNQLILEQQSISEKRNKLQEIVDDLQAKYDELQVIIHSNFKKCKKFA
jgi:predicted nuclease with TOPRIM domain